MARGGTGIGRRRIWLYALDQRMWVHNDPPGFVRFLAQVLADDVRAAVEEQRYAARYDPLTAAYVRRKFVAGWWLDFWRATGLMMRSVRAYWSGRRLGYAVDLGEERYPGSGVRIRDIARYLEWGTSTCPARPLFRPALHELRGKIRPLREFFGRGNLGARRR